MGVQEKSHVFFITHIRHRALAQGVTSCQPPFPKHQHRPPGPRTQEVREHRPPKPRREGFIGHPPPFLKFPKLLQSPFFIIFPFPLKSIPESLSAPKVSQKWPRKTKKTRENSVQEGVREKSPKMPHKFNPRTLQIYGFRWDVLQKPLYPPFAHNRNKCLKSTPKMDQNSLK